MGIRQYAAVYVYDSEVEARARHGSTPTAIVPWPSGALDDADRELIRDALGVLAEESGANDATDVAARNLLARLA